MTSLRSRILVAFVGMAMLPIALSLWLVWLEGAVGSRGELSQVLSRQLAQKERSQRRALTRLCRDDLAVDRVLAERAQGMPLDAGRVFSGIMRSLALDALWVIDAGTSGQRGEVLAQGHSLPSLAHGDALLADLEAAGDRAFLFSLTPDRAQTFHLAGCTISRSGARVAVVGGYRVGTLLALAPELLEMRVDAEDPSALWKSEDAQGEHSLSIRLRTERGPVLPYFLALSLASLVLALGVGWWVNRKLTGSLDELAAAAERVGRGDFETTLGEGSHREFAATATAFNRMTHELKAAQSQLRQAERVAAWREVAKRLAHELKNPLSPIQMSIENLRKAHERSSEDLNDVFDESTRTILDEVHRLRRIIDEFSRFARLPSPKLATFDLRALVIDVSGLYGSDKVLLEHQVPDEPVEALADREQLTQVLVNLVQNAIDASLAAHREEARVELTLRASDTEVTITVLDNGPGIPPTDTEAIFEPYFTTKQGGTGLGLAISQRIVVEHGGTLGVESSGGKGALFTVRLPRKA